MSSTQESSKRKIIYFKNPVFHLGLNYTVRWGGEWFDRLNAGDTLLLKQTGQSKIVCEAEVCQTIYCPYEDISPYILDHEHDPACRTFRGLDKAMHKAYSDFDPEFGFNYMVTCIGFVIKNERNTRTKRKK